MAQSLADRCHKAFKIVWHSNWSTGAAYSDKFLVLAPLLAKPLHQGFLSYAAQVFWTGFSNRLGTRAWLDQLATRVGGEDVEVQARPLGQILRNGVWSMDGEKTAGSGECHETHADSNFFTWVSDFYASSAGHKPSTYIAINYEGPRVKTSFLWEIELPIMAQVCAFQKPDPGFVVVDFVNECGQVVQDFFQRLQGECDRIRQDLGHDKKHGALTLDVACACKACPVPQGLGRKTEDMWHKAVAAIAAIES